MKQEYKNWIDKYVAEKKIVAGLCLSASSLMLKKFPELILCKGYVTDGCGKKHTHWFLKNEYGEIIDPTVSQFDRLLVAGNLKYEEYEVTIHGALPTNKCADCGNFIYDGKSFCSDICEKSTINYLNTRRKNVL